MQSPDETWPTTPEAREALYASTQSDLLGVDPGDVDGPTDDDITAASRKRGRAASELAPLLVPLSGACRPLALRRAHFARAEELALAVATLGSDPSASGVIRNQPGINRPRFETCTQTGYLGLPWPREEPSKLSELRKAIESAGLSTRGFAEKSEFRSAARRVDTFNVADWRVETEEGRREVLDEVFAMFRAGDFERFKESRRTEVWDALLRPDNQLGGVKFEGGRAEDLLVLAAAAELDGRLRDLRVARAALWQRVGPQMHVPVGRGGRGDVAVDVRHTAAAFDGGRAAAAASGGWACSRSGGAARGQGGWCGRCDRWQHPYRGDDGGRGRNG